MSCLLQRPYRANLEVERIPKTAKTAENGLNGTVSDTEGKKQPENRRLRNSGEARIQRGAAHRFGVLC